MRVKERASAEAIKKTSRACVEVESWPAKLQSYCVPPQLIGLDVQDVCADSTNRALFVLHGDLSTFKWYTSYPWSSSGFCRPRPPAGTWRFASA
jgi:hypothetical protein